MDIVLHVNGRAHRLAVDVRPNGEQLREIGRLIDDGKVRPLVARTFPLLQARAAQAFLEQEHPRGKVVLDVVAA